MPQEYKGIVAFDLEIATTVPERGDWHALRPLGITCAATVGRPHPDTGSTAPLAWFPSPTGAYDIPEGQPYPARMNAFSCCSLADYLLECQEDGYLVVSWNGLGFDFQVLLEECVPDYTRKRELAQLALDHVDPAFAILCGKGFMVALAAASEGMGLPGKTEGMSGVLAPEMWREGREAQDKVIEYVKQDAQATLDLYNAIVEARRLTWVTRQGRFSSWNPRFQSYTIGTHAHRRMLTCAESLELSVPDTSWMSDNSMWERERFHGWATALLAEPEERHVPTGVDDAADDWHAREKDREERGESLLRPPVSPEADILLDAVADVDTAALAGADEPATESHELASVDIPPRSDEEEEVDSKIDAAMDIAYPFAEEETEWGCPQCGKRFSKDDVAVQEPIQCPFCGAVFEPWQTDPPPSYYEEPVAAFASFQPYDYYENRLAEATECYRRYIAKQTQANAEALRRSLAGVEGVLARLRQAALHEFWAYGVTRPHEHVCVILDPGGTIEVIVEPPVDAAVMEDTCSP